MVRAPITGSSDGLGLMAGRLLVEQGHSVTLHACNPHRAADAGAALPGADGVLVGDLLSLAGIRSVAGQANAEGPFDAVIHNAGIGYREPRRIETVDGLSHLFTVNVFAPYLLTALITPPRRLVYLSSGMAHGGDADLSDPQWTTRRWNGSQAYSDSKLFDILLADNLAQAPVTQAWLAVSEDAATVTGRHFYHRQERPVPGEVHDPAVQDEFLAYCAELTGVRIPDAR